MGKNKVFITGATGFIGSHLARRLLTEGYEVHISLRKNSNTSRLKDILGKLSPHNLDILEATELRSFFEKVKPHYIFHLATSIVWSGHAPPDEELMKVNVVGTMNVIRAASAIPYEVFINTGSSSEYGVKGEPMREDDVCEPTTVHGVSKLAATLYGRAVAASEGKPIIGFRIFSPYGPYDDERRFIPTIVRKMLKGEAIDLSAPEVARDYIFVDDIVDLYIEAMGSGERLGGGIFNVGTGTQSTLGEVTNLIAQKAQSRSALRWGAFSRAPYDTDRWKADMTKTFKSFRWRPKTALPEGLSRTIAWIRHNS